MTDDYLAYFFRTLGTALLCCSLCWVALPKVGMPGSAQRLLFVKLVGVFMALHFASMTLYLGGANVVVTALATYAVGRWLFVSKPATPEN